MTAATAPTAPVPARLRPADLGRLAATLIVALIGNAAVCGVISDPHDRYGARIVWTAVFAVALAAWRASLWNGQQKISEQKSFLWSL